MADEFVTTQHTRIGAQALYSALRAAWRTQLGTEPTRASLLVLLAQWSLESNTGAACNNFNLAGIKYTPGCGRNYTSYMTTEVLRGQVVKMAQRFRAYDSLDEAAYDYLYTLRHDFRHAWPDVESGDVRAFARTLAALHYYTAPEGQYEAGLVARRDTLDQQIGADTSPDAVADVTPLPSTPLALADAATNVANDEQPSPPGTFTPPDAA